MANLESNFEIIRVTPTVIAGTTHGGDVMFNATEIPNAVIGNGGCSKLIGVSITDQDQENHNMDLIFMSVQTNLGTAGSAPNITDDDLLAADITSSLRIVWGNGSTSLGTASSIYTSSGHSDDDDIKQLPILLQANAGSTSVFFTAIAGGSDIDFAATDDLEFMFHIQKK